MSHILDYGKKFDELQKIVENASSKSIDDHTLTEDFDALIPKDKTDNPLVDTFVNREGIKTAMYMPDGNYIIASSRKIEAWLQINVTSFKEKYNISDIDLFRGYLYLYCLSHEIEHSYQQLIAKGIIEIDTPIIKEAYHNILKLFKKDSYILPRTLTKAKKVIALYRYRQNENMYVLERNASLEGYDLLYRLANYSQKEEMLKVFYVWRSLYSKCGYVNSNKGSFYETYQAILMKKKYEKIIKNCTVNDEEAIRYGLPITEKTREKVLTL